MFSFSSLLATTTSDLPNRCDFDLGGPCFASLVFIIVYDPLARGLRVNCRFPFPPSWLQLLTTFLVVVVFILVVQILHFLCL